MKNKLPFPGVRQALFRGPMCRRNSKVGDSVLPKGDAIPTERTRFHGFLGRVNGIADALFPRINYPELFMLVIC